MSRPPAPVASAAAHSTWKARSPARKSGTRRRASSHTKPTAPQGRVRAPGSEAPAGPAERAGLCPAAPRAAPGQGLRHRAEPAGQRATVASHGEGYAAVGAAQDGPAVVAAEGARGAAHHEE